MLLLCVVDVHLVRALCLNSMARIACGILLATETCGCISDNLDMHSPVTLDADLLVALARGYWSTWMKAYRLSGDTYM